MTSKNSSDYFSKTSAVVRRVHIHRPKELAYFRIIIFTSRAKKKYINLFAVTKELAYFRIIIFTSRAKKNI